ncbi:MAG: radical SAM protein [Betaproteobacteria bacterium]|nr:radical SAM protein [Betaproteobacteria bacterium]
MTAAECLVPAPTIVSWNITRRCNLACGHCYLDAVQRRAAPTSELNTSEALSVVEQIAELAPGAMLVLTGGEPLLRADLVTLVNRAAASGLAPVIGTNGTLLSKRRAAELKGAGAAGVGISVDSAGSVFHDRLRGVPGAWRGALRGAAAARRAGMAVSLQAILFEQNRDDLAALADLAESLGAMALNFFFLVCTGRGATCTDLAPAAYDEMLARIIELQASRPDLLIRARCAPYQRRLLGLPTGGSAESYSAGSGACLAGRSYFRITPEGQVTPCPYIPEMIGDLRNTALRSIWEHQPVLTRLRTELPGGKCGTCDFRYSCGGCRARALAQHGDMMAEDTQCAYVVPGDALPERAPTPQPANVAWEPAAQALLERIPAFARTTVKARLEQAAAREEISRITVEFMRAHRPHFPLGARLAGPDEGTMPVCHRAVDFVPKTPRQ